MSDGKIATIVPIVVALIGLASSPAWGPPLCRAAGVCSEIKETNGSPKDGAAREAPPPPFSPARIFLSLTSGPAGTEIKVSGQGFSPEEEIVFSFHTREIGRTNAGSNGSFSGVAVTVPKYYGQFAPQQFHVKARGESSGQTANAPFTIGG